MGELSEAILGHGGLEEVRTHHVPSGARDQGCEKVLCTQVQVACDMTVAELKGRVGCSTNRCTMCATSPTHRTRACDLLAYAGPLRGSRPPGCLFEEIAASCPSIPSSALAYRAETRSQPCRSTCSVSSCSAQRMLSRDDASRRPRWLQCGGPSIAHRWWSSGSGSGSLHAASRGCSCQRTEGPPHCTRDGCHHVSVSDRDRGPH